MTTRERERERERGGEGERETDRKEICGKAEGFYVIQNFVPYTVLVSGYIIFSALIFSPKIGPHGYNILNLLYAKYREGGYAIFCKCSDRPSGQNSLLYYWYQVCFSGVERRGA